MANILTESKPIEKSREILNNEILNNEILKNEILKNEIHDVLIMTIRDLWANLNLTKSKHKEESTKETKKGRKEEPKEILENRNHPIIDSSKSVSSYEQNHLLIDFVKKLISQIKAF